MRATAAACPLTPSCYNPPMLWWTLRQLKSSNATTRAKAAASLGVAENTAATGPLVEALRDPETDVRVAALTALGAIGDAAGAEGILTAVRESEAGRTAEMAARIRAAASEALGQLGPKAAPRLVAALKDKNARVREAAIAGLGGVGGSDVERALAAALGDDRSAIRQAAALALARAAGQRAIEPLAAALAHRDPQTRRSAAEALGAIGGDEAASTLSAAVREKDQAVREAVVRALGRIGTRTAVSALLTVYSGSDREARQAAAAALKQARWEPGDARERVIHAAIDGDYAKAAREGDVAVELLAAAAGDRDPAVRRAAAGALGDVGAARAADPLVSALADHDEGVRRAAVGSLQRLGPAAFHALVSALDDRAAAVRHAARELLQSMPQVDGATASRLALLRGRVPRRVDPAGAEPGGPEAVLDIVGPDAVAEARAALEDLERTLRQAADHVPAAELGEIAALPDLVLLEQRDDPALAEQVSCEPLRARAREELARRARA
jgi:HEAT repeat protein